MELSRQTIAAIAIELKKMLSDECMILSENEAKEYKRYKKLLMKEYITGSEAARLLGYKPATITRKRKAGLIPAEYDKDRKRWLYPINALLNA